MTPFERLLAALPSVYDTDAHPTAALRITSVGVRIRIAGGTLTVVTGLTTHALPLTSGTTLHDVVQWLQGIVVDAVLLRPDLGDRSARLLLDTPEFTTAGNDDLYVFQNLLYVLLRPPGVALEERSERVTDALTQLNLLTATGFWADLWGRYLNIARKPSEADATYTARMKHQTIRQRLNNRALEQILLDDLGIDATVEDLLPLVLIWNETNWHSYWPGNIYQSGAFRVRFTHTGVDSRDIIALIDKHRAAGTRFVLYGAQEIQGQVSLIGRIIIATEQVWEARWAGLLQRARVAIGDSVTEVAIARRAEWHPSRTAFPGSVISF